MAVRRRAAGIVGVGIAGLLLVSCGYGRTTAAYQVTDVSARLTGEVRNTVTGSTTWYFEYGVTTSYGSATPTGTQQVSSVEGTYRVEASVSGLAEATTYHYRLCAHDVDGHGLCGSDATVTTTGGQDSVTGQGRLPQIVSPRFEVGGYADAHSAPDGSGASGVAGATPGAFAPQFHDSGPVTCLRVIGNRAAIGYIAQDSILDPDLEFTAPRMVFVEDNGSSGDRWGAVILDAPATTCPVPTEADFLGFPISVGDFIVHDHVSSP